MAELQAAMSSREFAEWVAYASVAPMPAERADLRAGTVAALIAEVNRDRKQRSKPYTVGEFAAFFRGEEPGAPAQDREAKSAELWANLKAWAVWARAGKRRVN